MITGAQIEQLQRDATAVRNYLLARYCRMALHGDTDALAIAGKVLRHEPAGPSSYRVDTHRVEELATYLDGQGMRYAVADDGTVFVLATAGELAGLQAQGFTPVLVRR